MQMIESQVTRPIRVLLITEGTYPFFLGGVSNWCQMLIRQLPQVHFKVLSLVGDLQMNPRYTLPPNVIEFRPVPLWGTREALESRRDLSLTDIYRRVRDTTEAVVARSFIPSFESFLSGIYSDEPSLCLGQPIHEMHRFFLAHDLDAALRSQAAWDCFTRVSRRFFPVTAVRCGYPCAEFSLADMTDAMSLLYRWLIPLAAPLPAAEVAHAVSAGLCSLVAVTAKMENHTAFLLTEHGIYLRERYLAEAESPSTLFLKMFSLRFVRRITELCYAMADLILPGSDYNQRWELYGGARLEQLQTVHNGVDPAEFTPASRSSPTPLVVVWLGRITPIKDLITLLRAAAMVREQRPDIEFRLYGSASAGDEAYYKTCMELRADLGVEDAVVFGGYAASAEAVFNEGDIVVLSSISEGFPYSVIEAMLCAKPIVATAVGGVPEAVEECGLTVEPRNPEEMAQAILSLMNDPVRREELGQAARQKAVQEFNLNQCGEAYLYNYKRLTSRVRMTALSADLKPAGRLESCLYERAD
jgi:glycosyltransferase involved in cell wall biosynthesis